MIRNTAAPEAGSPSASGSQNVMGEESRWNQSQGEGQPSSSPFLSNSPGRASRPLILLLAEDNLPDALLVREAIRVENLPLEIHVAKDGERAIDFLEKGERDAPRADVLLLDINLPKMNGFEVLRRIRGRKEYTRTPVLIITSSDSPADRTEAAKLGAGYFRKPPSYDEFLKIGPALRRVLEESALL